MINFIAVFIVAGIYFVLGWLWYSPLLLGNIWMKSIGKTQDELEMLPKDFIISIIISIVMPLFLAILLEIIGTYDVVIALLVSLVVWVGFVATFELYPVIYVGKKFTTYLIDTLYHLAGLIIAGLILGLWRI